MSQAEDNWISTEEGKAYWSPNEGQKGTVYNHVQKIVSLEEETYIHVATILVLEERLLWSGVSLGKGMEFHQLFQEQILETWERKVLNDMISRMCTV